MDSSFQNLIANIGFPIALSMYLLVRIEAKFDKLSECMNELTISIREHNRMWFYDLL